MSLSTFIIENLEQILMEWESFAATIIPAQKFEKHILRDHAEAILKAIALDMRNEETEADREKKSHGLGHRIDDQETGAESHSRGRLEIGFNQTQMVSEYRALRAAVVRIWMSRSPVIDDTAIEELIRFNEGIDQALSESTAQFMQGMEQARDFATAILAHDLRNPLSTILTSAQSLQMQIAAGVDRSAISRAGSIITTSGLEMSKLIENLLDFTRTRLGQPLAIKRESVDIANLCRATVDAFRVLHPQRTFHLNCEGDRSFAGSFDGSRIGELLSNLIGNATQHSSEATPITITGRLESSAIVLEVHNTGLPIPPAVLPTIFDPWVSSANQGRAQSRRLGLGLYIAREIVVAHGGTIGVTSTEEQGTTFVVSLPMTDPKTNHKKKNRKK